MKPIVTHIKPIGVKIPQLRQKLLVRIWAFICIWGNAIQITFQRRAFETLYGELHEADEVATTRDLGIVRIRERIGALQ